MTEILYLTKNGGIEKNNLELIGEICYTYKVKEERVNGCMRRNKIRL